jgi:DNA-nicking Smr family endonuclease
MSTMQRGVLMNSGTIEVDIHGMNRLQAKNHIEGVIKRAKKDVYRIRIVHGYQGGTKLKEMVQKDFKNHSKVLRTEVGLNPGSTDLVLRELF